MKSTSTTSTEAIPEEGEEEDHSEDQMIEPSIQRIRPHDTESNSISEVGTEINSNIQDTSLEILGDIALSLNPLHQAPLPTKRQKLVSSSTTTTTTTTSRPQKNNGRHFFLNISICSLFLNCLSLQLIEPDLDKDLNQKYQHLRSLLQKVLCSRTAPYEEGVRSLSKK